MGDSILVEKSGLSYVIKGLTEKPLKIPSQMFPLKGQPLVFNYNNTENFPNNFETEAICKVYDSIKANIGTCYSNIENLLSALEKEGIYATSYVGWVFLGGSRLVHHCFAAIDNHIMDFSPLFEQSFIEKYANSDISTIQNEVVNKLLSMKSKPNSEKTIFGKAPPYALYIAAQCKPMQGLHEFQKLMKAFPKHPSYTNLASNSGLTKTQELFYKRGIERE